MVSIDEFGKMDIRVGEIKSAENHPNADKLCVLKVDLGSEERTIVTGIKGHYELDKLVGRKIVVIVNLDPVVLRGVKSEGMLLAAGSDDRKEICLLDVDSKAENGWKVS